MCLTAIARTMPNFDDLYKSTWNVNFYQFFLLCTRSMLLWICQIHFRHMQLLSHGTDGSPCGACFSSSFNLDWSVFVYTTQFMRNGCTPKQVLVHVLSHADRRHNIEDDELVLMKCIVLWSFVWQLILWQSYVNADITSSRMFYAMCVIGGRTRYERPLWLGGLCEKLCGNNKCDGNQRNAKWKPIVLEHRHIDIAPAWIRPHDMAKHAT